MISETIDVTMVARKATVYIEKGKDQELNPKKDL